MGRREFLLDSLAGALAVAHASAFAAGAGPSPIDANRSGNAAGAADAAAAAAEPTASRLATIWNSSLVLLDGRSGALRGQWRLPDRRLSLRHIAWNRVPEPS